MREVRERRQHEREQQQHGAHDHDDLGHEGQGLFLDLRDRLEEGDDQADDEPEQHDRRAELQCDDDRIARDVDGIVGGHGRLPPALPRTPDRPQIGMRRMSWYAWTTRSRNAATVWRVTSALDTAVTTCVRSALPVAACMLAV